MIESIKFIGERRHHGGSFEVASTRSAWLMASLHALAESQDGEAAFLRLGQSIHEGTGFSGAIAELKPAARERLSARIGGPRLSELLALDQETDPELFFGQLFRYSLRLREEGLEGPAVRMLALLARPPIDGIPPSIQARALREWEALSGQGEVGPRAEYLLQGLAKHATDPRMILPMLGASVLGRAVGAGLLGRLLGGSEVAWYSRGLGARWFAGFGGFAVEVSAFAAAHRLADSHPERSFAGGWVSSALTIGVLKTGGLLAGKGRAMLPTAGPARRFGDAALVPVTMFLGLSAAPRLEAKLGFRPRVDDATATVDTLAAMLSLGVGIRLGSYVLGPRFAAFQQELRWGSENAQRPPGLGLRPPLLAGVAGTFPSRESFRGPQVFMSSIEDPGKVLSPVTAGGGTTTPNLRLPRRVRSSQGREFPFDLISSTPKDLWRVEGRGLAGQRITIAERDGIPLQVTVEKHEVNRVGDPITPEGALKLHFRLEEGATRGKAFVYANQDSLTLYFVDLEETMITKGPPMRPGTGSVFFTWLAEQAKAEGKRFNVTRITSPQTVKILLKQNLMDLERSCVEACNRINPEAYDEEYRVVGRFALGDNGAWNQYRREVEFFNIFGIHP